MSEGKEYSVDLQRLFVEFLSQDQDLFVRVNAILDPQFFDRELRKTVEFVQSHATQYQALPTLDQIKANTNLELQPLKDVDDRHKKWFIDEFVDSLYLNRFLFAIHYYCFNVVK